MSEDNRDSQKENEEACAILKRALRNLVGQGIIRSRDDLIRICALALPQSDQRSDPAAGAAMFSLSRLSLFFAVDPAVSHHDPGSFRMANSGVRR
ncbi:hypothetical protein [Citrobacter sp. R-1.5.2]|uniref:hypothetical protein n=1 Tax=Citrobacter sp. R-1.5.2 TaxID=3046183 RepID=UPI002B245BA7|nr:hypothetical protein [Citrobacter sp. R-1.5.2]MEB2421528.1 hypothetical protein [Citrobacter sp. R-1.5.2]